MIRKGDYKLIVYPEAETTLLFDLNADPLEMNDLSGTKSTADIEKALFMELTSLQFVMDDTVDIKSTFPKLANWNVVVISCFLI